MALGDRSALPAVAVVCARAFSHVCMWMAFDDTRGRWAFDCRSGGVEGAIGQAGWRGFLEATSCDKGAPLMCDVCERPLTQLRSTPLECAALGDDRVLGRVVRLFLGRRARAGCVFLQAN